MKINLISNSKLVLPKHLSELNVKYGFSYNGNVSVTEDDVFSLKLLSKVQSFFNVSKINQSLINSLTEVVNYVNNNYNNKKIDYLGLQINNDTKLNKLMRNTFSLLIEKDSPLLTIFDSNDAMINTKNNQIVLGTDFLNSKSPFTSSLLETNTKEKTIEFVFLHELSHSLEYAQENNNYSNFFNTILSRVDSLTYFKTFQKINNSTQFPIREELIRNLSLLKSEIYADVSATLIQRNFDINKGIHNIKNTDMFIDSLINARNKEHMSYKNDVTMRKFILDCGHLSSPGLEELKEHLLEVGDRSLSEEEINKITQKCVEKGIVKIIYATVNADNTTVPQFKTLFSMRFNEDTGEPYVNDNDETSYKKMMGMIKNSLDKDWTEEFNKNINRLNDMEVSDEEYIEQAFNIGLRKEQFEVFINFKKNYKINSVKVMNEINLAVKNLEDTINNLGDSYISNSNVKHNIELIKELKIFEDITKNNILKTREKIMGSKKDVKNQLK